jgi:hypothetical protein
MHDKVAVDEAGKLGMKMCLYDDPRQGYPMRQRFTDCEPEKVT